MLSLIFPRVLKYYVGEINEGRYRDTGMWSDHQPGHESIDQTYQMVGKQEKKNKCISNKTRLFSLFHNFPRTY